VSAQQTVLLLGATGRTGSRVLSQLLSRGVAVHVIVRSAGKLRATASGKSNLTIVESELMAMSDEDLKAQVRGCDAVISCLGHVISLKGIFGPPRDLVERTVSRVCGAIEALKPLVPVRVLLMSSVSVNHPEGLDTRRGALEKAFLWLLRGLVPPANDNQRATDFLVKNIGINHPLVQWVAVRPDTLLEGEVSGYVVHDYLVNGLFAPGSSTMANVAHFMCELNMDPATWEKWRGKLPVIVNVSQSIDK
jgi:hypothetical protein